MNSIITRSLEKDKIKKKKSPNKFSLKNEYSNFLKKKATKSPKKKVSKSPKKKIAISENRKDPIFIKTNNMKKSPKKPRNSKKVSINNESKLNKKEPSKPNAKEVNKPDKKVPDKKVPDKKVPDKPIVKKDKNIVSLKSKRRFSKKSKRRKLDKKHTKSRKISFKCYPQKDKNIGEVIEKANKVSDSEMKKELLSNGIEIKGTKNKLLKDIYMFSLLGGIKIQKE